MTKEVFVWGLAKQREVDGVVERPFDATAALAGLPWSGPGLATRRLGAAAIEPVSGGHGPFDAVEAAIRDTGTWVASLEPASGDAPVGGSFLCGDVADLGDLPWPSRGNKPMQHLVQIGADVLEAIGAPPVQRNVFVSKFSSSAEVEVVLVRPGSARVTRRGTGHRPHRALRLESRTTVYPTCATLGNTGGTGGSRFLDVVRALAEDVTMWVQHDYEEAFPNAEGLAVKQRKLLVGGYANVIGKRSAQKWGRLFTVPVKAFPDQLRGFRTSAGTGVAVEENENPATSWLCEQ
jgi:hypothetical protein